MSGAGGDWRQASDVTAMDFSRDLLVAESLGIRKMPVGYRRPR